VSRMRRAKPHCLGASLHSCRPLHPGLPPLHVTYEHQSGQALRKKEQHHHGILGLHAFASMRSITSAADSSTVAFRSSCQWDSIRPTMVSASARLQSSSGILAPSPNRVLCRSYARGGRSRASARRQKACRSLCNH
jgi:hypothetical protein